MRRHAIHLGAAWEPPTAPGGPWIRRFGRPTGVAAGDRVLLVWDPPPALRPDAVRLNGQAIAAEPEVDVTPLLRDRNELALDASGAPGNADVGKLVALPVDCGRPALVIESSD